MTPNPAVNRTLRQKAGGAPVTLNVRHRRAREASTGNNEMKLGYVIAYVPNVSDSLKFYSQAFGFEQKFLHESGTYGELSTGSTTLSFAAHELGDANFQGGHVRASASAKPLGIEIAIVTDDVASAHKKAIQFGAKELSPPSQKPWGQTVSYVRAPDGVLVEICTPVPA